MMKNIWQCCKQIRTHCFFVESYYVLSYCRFLNTGPGERRVTVQTTDPTFAPKTCFLLTSFFWRIFNVVFFLYFEVKKNRIEFQNKEKYQFNFM
jgi:hypothetical protein